jgi:hypothetical protein
MALNLADLRAMPDEELIRTYDQMAENSPPTVNMSRDELNRRVYERDAEAMRDLTRWTVRLAAVSVVIAVVALVVAVISLWR